MRELFLKYDRQIQRFLEILPGFVSWNLILFPVWGSFVIPHVVAYYIITFDVYWLYRSFMIAILALLAHFRIRASQSYNWMMDVKGFKDWKKVHHILLIPTYKEPLKTLRRTLIGIKKQTFPKENIIVVLAFEKKEGKQALEKAKILKEEFSEQFECLWTTLHPITSGEVAGKSSNTAWAAKFVKRKLIEEEGRDSRYYTITSEDADAILPPQYLACLTYKFLDSPHRYRRIWQAAIVFYNNIWRLPIPSRVYNTICSIIQMGILMRRDRLINFSTYSTSLQMAVEVGLWDANVIPEDYRFFFKSFFKLKGEVEVEPIFLPVFADAAESTSFFKTFINQYEQVKRWAWGVSDDAYIIKGTLTTPDLPFWDKIMRLAKVIEDHFLWPVNWFAITLGAILPPLLNPVFARTVLGKTLPQVSSLILSICLASLILIIFIDWRQRPKPPDHVSRLRRLISPLEFILLPVVGFFFTALPGLDAHTRLMLGKYLEYRVTEKV